MTNHLLAAAQHARSAAHHAAAAGDRTMYWALLASTECLAGDPELCDIFSDLSVRCAQAELPEPG